MLLRRFILAGLLGLASSTGCGDDGGFPRDAAGPDVMETGTVSLAWSITDLNDQPIPCDEVNASSVFLQLRDPARLSGSVESFSCQNSPSTSHPLEPGTYDITYELHGINLTAVSAQTQSGVKVEVGKDTPLNPITFKVDAQGSLALALAAPPATTNCKPAGMMGAGITGITITLVHTGDGCAPVTFVRSRGAVMLGSYVVNCSSPMVTTCIENDERLSVASMQSGPYTIQVRGKIGAVDCWKNDDALQVPPQGKMLNQTLNLAYQTGTPGC